MAKCLSMMSLPAGSFEVAACFCAGIIKSWRDRGQKRSGSEWPM